MSWIIENAWQMWITKPSMIVTTVLILAVLATGVLIWRVTHMPGKSYQGRAPALTASQLSRRARLEADIRVLASEIGERNLTRPPAYAAAAEYIHRSMQKVNNSAYRESFHFADDTSDNIVADVPGRSKAGEIVIVGAHYDTVPGSPGANDNASGVSVLLELARAFQHSELARSVRFVAFANEESPYFGTSAMGSLRHLRNAQDRREHIVAMLSLESLGVYFEEPNSQRYPPPFSWFYPSTANFVGFVADTQSRKLLHRAIQAFRRTAQLPSEGVAAPRFIRDVRRSDHLSYWRAGIPALMITDTANFRYPLYHTADDTIDVLNFDALTRLTDGLIAALTVIANPP